MVCASCMGARMPLTVARIAGDDGFDTLAIEPAGGFDGGCAADGGDVGVDETAEAVSDPGGDAGKAGAGGSENDGGSGGAAEGYASGGVGGVARLGEGFAGDGQEFCRRQTFGKVRHVRGDDADGEGGAKAGGEFKAGGDGFERGLGECGACFVDVGKY